MYDYHEMTEAEREADRIQYAAERKSNWQGWVILALVINVLCGGLF